MFIGNEHLITVEDIPNSEIEIGEVNDDFD